MTDSKYRVLAIVSATVSAILLASLLIQVRLSNPLISLHIAALAVLLVVSTLVATHKHFRDRQLSPRSLDGSDADQLLTRLKLVVEHERRLELRELRLARQMRTSQFSTEDYIDLVQVDPSDEELEELANKDRMLIGLIEAESQLAFKRILKNRYAAESGVNTQLILQDIRTFVTQVAILYRPDTADPLLETEIELIAKSLSSASLHLLVVIDGLPLNLKSYNTARMYKLIRRGASYYGTYKAFRPYMEHGMNALHMGRLALGMNPLAVGASWLAGKLTSYGAKSIGERVLQRRSLQLLNDFIRIIGFEAAMMYGGDFRHRDANWVLGAELVNLEVSRKSDLGGRDAALKKLCSLVMRHEFDRIHLLSHLARHKFIDVARTRPQIALTQQERDQVAGELLQHCVSTNVNLDDSRVTRWRKSAEATLLANIEPKS